MTARQAPPAIATPHAVTRPLPALLDPSRTIPLGRAGTRWANLLTALGIGEYHPPADHISSRLRPHSGWFVNAEEHAVLLAAALRAQVETRKAANARRRVSESRAQSGRRVVRSTTITPTNESIARAISAWRLECSDPQSPRTHEQSWIYAYCAIHAIDPDARSADIPPMPAERPAERVPRAAVLVEFASRREGGEMGRPETEIERDHRARMQARQRKKPRSASTAGAGYRR